MLWPSHLGVFVLWNQTDCGVTFAFAFKPTPKNVPFEQRSFQDDQCSLFGGLLCHDMKRLLRPHFQIWGLPQNGGFPSTPSCFSVSPPPVRSTCPVSSLCSTWEGHRRAPNELQQPRITDNHTWGIKGGLYPRLPT